VSRRRTRKGIPLAGSCPGFEDQLCDWLDLDRAIRSLPLTWQSALQLLHEGYTDREAASRLGVCPRTVQVWRTKARARIQELLDADEEAGRA
jgi:DNA-directed RNA polymerase specialized sigma24 family protein